MGTGGIRVMKFGGSCLGDPESFSKVVNIISMERDCLVVISALKGVTGAIIGFVGNSVENTDIKGLMDFLFRRHMDIALPTLNESYLENFEGDLRSSLKSIEAYGSVMIGDPGNMEKHSAFLQSFGEKISASLAAYALRQKGLAPVEHYADDLGIITEGSYLNGTVSTEETAENIRNPLLFEIRDGKIPVVTGYIGRNSRGETTLLGRDGSDYTASIVASCVGSTDLTLWKDVDGIMTGDPKNQVQCSVIRKLTYEQAERLSMDGAKILHPLAVSQAKKERVNIRVRSLFEPFSEGSIIQ